VFDHVNSWYIVAAAVPMTAFSMAVTVSAGLTMSIGMTMAGVSMGVSAKMDLTHNYRDKQIKAAYAGGDDVEIG
jgi:hypothetical protein